MERFRFKGKRKDNGEWIEGYYGYKDLLNEHYITIPRLDTNVSYAHQYFVDYEVYPDSVEIIKSPSN